ncbi:VOC family protein [Chitinophaga japonensis]|uniref:PhnB protein n=1 Tax=Chitinophaga japonensis TaxID=104662 RepID=A0A562T6L1_CHIJA|nr:VOC family protein [Chitinophaga japonensis]TWI88993.1 PhnB protein [Chitinophaga japonensis]
MATINPYLNFEGNCEAAFEFYRSVFGGSFTTKSYLKDAPSDQPVPPEYDNMIMHIALPIGPSAVLMGSDRPKTFGPMTTGDNFHIAVHPASEAEADQLFNGLAAGGQVIMPMNKTFWGAYFGMLKDKFGVQWMVNHDLNQQQ